MRAVIDTNVLVDYLNGIDNARTELALHDRPLISLITWMEILVGAKDDAERLRLRAFLARLGRISIDDDVSERAVAIRRQRPIRLPDAIIWATAQSQGALLVTRNTKDFPADDPGIRIPYELG